MSTPDQPLPAATLTREAIAQAEVGITAVRPATARLLAGSFLLAIAVVPVVEFAGLQARRAGSDASAWAHLAGIPGAVRAGVDTAGVAGPWPRIVSANRQVLAGLSAFERALEHESVLGRALRPRTQAVLARWGGAGNERVYVGRDGWLFYRPDVEYVTGRPFLDGREMRRRVTAAPEWTAPPQPDPRAAILEFARDLEARGIALVVVPTPVKPGVHPERLAVRYTDSGLLPQNPSYPALLGDLARAGVLVFDPSQALVPERRAGPLYLQTDTHWLPEAMELVAERLAAFIATHVDLPPHAEGEFKLERREVRNTGDTARMLDLPAGSTRYPPETVWVRRVLRPDGSPWRSTRTADVLLLGDSFSNIYSLESMGWGTSAGFAEQLSYALRRPLDRLIQNDQGAFATREMLARDSARLEGKRVVIYQFAARELASGDWKRLPLAGPDAGR